MAERALAARGFDVAGRKALGVFDHDDEAKVFLERELGLTRAVPLLGREVPVWRWSFRFVKPLEKGELRAFVSPAGELLSFRRILPEKAAAADAGSERARAMAEETLRTHRGLDPAALRFVEATEEKRPARVDRTFVWESKALRWNGAAIRYLVEVQGDQVGRSSLWLDVPEAWRQAYATLRSKNQAAGAVATFGLILTALALVLVFFDRLRRRDVKWRWALAFAMTGTALQMAASLNELPITLFSYETTESWASFLAQALLSDFGAACLLGLLLLLLVAGGEPEYREAYPEKPALGRVFSRRAFGTKRVFLGLLAGYALTAGFFAYQVLFYLAADRLGAWSPADVPYSNLLGTSLPWLGVLLMGFVPATTEEFSSRMFSIPFLSRFAPAWVAVGVPALIWGFAHSSYPEPAVLDPGRGGGTRRGRHRRGDAEARPLSASRLALHGGRGLHVADPGPLDEHLLRRVGSAGGGGAAAAAGGGGSPRAEEGRVRGGERPDERRGGLGAAAVARGEQRGAGDRRAEAPLAESRGRGGSGLGRGAAARAGGPAARWAGCRRARFAHGRDRVRAGLREDAGGRPGPLPGRRRERLGAAVARGRGGDGRRAHSLPLGAQRGTLAAGARRDAGAASVGDDGPPGAGVAGAIRAGAGPASVVGRRRRAGRPRDGLLAGPSGGGGGSVPLPGGGARDGESGGARPRHRPGVARRRLVERGGAKGAKGPPDRLRGAVAGRGRSASPRDGERGGSDALAGGDGSEAARGVGARAGTEHDGDVCGAGAEGGGLRYGARARARGAAAGAPRRENAMARGGALGACS